MKIVIIFFCLSCFTLYGQKHDNVWILGGASISDTAYGFQWGTMIADFDHEPFGFRYDSKITLDLSHTGTSISDKDGILQMYTNGQSVHHRFHKPVPGLDTISYGPYWENFNYQDYPKEGENWISGFPIEKGALMLPSFTHDQYVLFSFLRSILPNDNINFHINKLLMTEVKFTPQIPSGKVLYKEKLVLEGLFHGGYSATRHANGRDWWIVIQGEYNAAIYVFLYTPKGVDHIHTFTDTRPTNEIFTYAVGNFDREGTIYATSDSDGLNPDSMYLTIYGFDRCTGIMSQRVSKTLKGRAILNGSLEFAPSNHYMYVSNGFTMFQYDITVADILATERIIAEYDGSIFSYGPGDPGTNLFLSSMQTAPDGRIYCIPPGNARSMHVIDYPDEKGKDVEMMQNKFKLPCQIFNSIPSYPNYRLGPLDGSPCDTLGLDNHPIAKYRYEADNINHLKVRFTDLSYFRPETWSWDFGDDSPRVNTRHTYHSFRVNGTYNVCLTVSNENSVNTVCRTITIGTSSSDDTAPSTKPDITLFPNPVEDMLLITIGEYIPEHGQVTVYDITGQQVIRQRVYYGHNNVDMSQLPAGTYLLRILDNNKTIKEEKVVKM